MNDRTYIKGDIISLVNKLCEDFELFDDDISEIETAYFSEYKIPSEYTLYISDLLNGKSYVIMQNMNNTNFVVIFQTMVLKCIDKADYIEFLEFLKNEVNKI